MDIIQDIHTRFRYESAHHLPMVPPGHKCGRQHGHSYHLTVTMRGPVREDGFVMDFAEVKDLVEPLIKQLDHHNLNDIPGLENPTVELQLVWLWDRIEHPLLFELHLQETDNNSATYRGPAVLAYSESGVA